MIRHHLAVACVLATIGWASLGVAQFPPAGPASLAQAAPAPSHAVPVRTAALVGITVLAGVASVGFGRERRRRAHV